MARFLCSKHFAHNRERRRDRRVPALDVNGVPWCVRSSGKASYKAAEHRLVFCCQCELITRLFGCFCCLLTCASPQEARPGPCAR